MPIYEYECQDCHHHFERIEKFSDVPLSECPKCHQASVSRLVSAPSFQLKGSGWYETDFKNKGKPAEAHSSTTSSKKEESSSAANQADTSKKASSKGESV